MYNSQSKLKESKLLHQNDDKKGYIFLILKFREVENHGRRHSKGPEEKK